MGTSYPAPVPDARTLSRPATDDGDGDEGSPRPLRPLTTRIPFGWVLEIAGGAIVYTAYSQIREHVTGSGLLAFHHALDIVGVERFFGIFQEGPLQRALLSERWFISLNNIYYGTIHFLMPLLALSLLYLKMPARYVRWRNTFVIMLGLGVLTFWLYPLMPPRLMPARFGFVDTAAAFNNLGPRVNVTLGPGFTPSARTLSVYGNLFAAMPSFHVAWSTWSALALWPVVRRRWLKVLLVAYPITIVFCVTVTGNHWFLDAVGGWACVVAAYGLAVLVEVARTAWFARRAGAAALAT